uniref:CUE domain-containing protein n=1 Tax=Ananas comosus var. bracteatus TaxID=296719 RepID=A0A6V7QT42_ANACO
MRITRPTTMHGNLRIALAVLVGEEASLLPLRFPVRSPDLALGSEDKVSFLLSLFPSMDREVIESVLNNHDHKIDDAIKSLHALCLGDGAARNDLTGLNDLTALNSMLMPNDNPTDSGMNSERTEQHVESTHAVNVNSGESMLQNRAAWVDMFVQEMMNASDWDDVRGRAMKFLEAFERNVVENATASAEDEANSLKEQLQCLIRDNQILKKAVAIQHERNLEHEEKVKEVQQLKLIISQYQEQVRNLEMTNYTLKVHLQKAQEANSIPNHFHPDIF